MLKRPLRPLVLLALVAPVLVAVPASATRPDSVAPAYAVDEWTDSDFARLPDQQYSRVEVTYDATYGITLDGQVRTSTPSWMDWARPEQKANLIAPTFDAPIVDVTGGTNFGMALDESGHLHTWGQAPVISDDDLDTVYRDVAAVGTSAIGVAADGTLRYWGGAASQYPFGVVSDVVSIDIDGSAAVALTDDGHVLSAGGAITGEWSAEWTFPTDRADDVFTAVDAGVEFAVGLTDDGEIVAWGVSNHGQTTVPELPAGRHAVAVSAGMWMAAAVLDDGSIVQWGTNNADGERTTIPAKRPGVPVADIDVERYRVAVTYPTFSAKPSVTVTGTSQVGRTLVASASAADPVADDVSWSWFVAPIDEWSAPEQIAGASSDRLVLPARLAGRTVFARVTTSKEGLVSVTADSDGAEVASGTLRTPTVRVSGKPRVGQVLTATATKDPLATATYRWLRDGKAIGGATKSAYRVTSADLGRRLSVEATTRATGYTTAAATSSRTSAVTLAAKRLAVSAPQVTSGQVVTITVKGLASREKFAVTISGKRVTGTASSSGVGSARFRITGKAGNRAVKAVGSVADRVGSATLKVVRK